MLINLPAVPLYGEPYSTELDDEAWYGQQAEITDDMGEYCRVRMEYGYQSCIRRRYLADAQYQNTPAMVTFPFGDVRREPDIKSALLLTLPRGAKVEPLSEDNGWTGIRLIDGREGYICSRAVTTQKTASLSRHELRKNIVETAMDYLGVPYRWGGRTPVGVDCSGLCHSAYLINGIAIYRNAAIQPEYPVRSIPFADAGAGDLLYFPGHMAMYLGEGRFIHASASEGKVCIGSFDKYSPDYRQDLAESFIWAGSVF
ncbi:MAG: C40 family peptidase [Clostridia bacterium]|nr:C40 family peptidase [Clostridia bacterium]